MEIGIPRERRPDENRVGLTPALVGLLVAGGHSCFVERGAGLGAGFADDNFARNGARIVYTGDEVYGRADLVVKVGRPIAEELGWLRAGQALMAFWHLASASPDNLDSLLRQQITAIAYETIQSAGGSLPVLRPMSQIAGKMAAPVAAGLLQNDQGGKGVLLGGVTGVAPAEVVILDIAIDQGGCVETSRPTTHQSPTFVAERVIHYCVPNMPGVLGRTATHALANAIWPFVYLLATAGVEAALAADPVLAHGVATHAGQVGSPALHGLRPP